MRLAMLVLFLGLASPLQAQSRFTCDQVFEMLQTAPELRTYTRARLAALALLAGLTREEFKFAQNCLRKRK